MSASNFLSNKLAHSLGIAGVLLGGVASAAESVLPFSVVAPSEVLRPGQQVEVQVIVFNPTEAEAALAFPEVITARFVQADLTREVVLHAADPMAPTIQTVPSHSFRAAGYSLTVPTDAWTGPANLDVPLASRQISRGALMVSIWPPSDQDPQLTPAQPVRGLLRTRTASAALRRTFVDRISAHEPIYLLYGAKAPGAKLQFSFKYKLLDFQSIAPDHMAQTLQLGFTQRSLWDTGAVSSPFYDTSYMPELIYEVQSPYAGPESGGRNWLGAQLALRHESNGKAGDDSRSANMVSLRSAFIFGRFDSWHMVAIPEVFTYASSLGDNADLKNFRDWGSVRLILSRTDGPSLNTALWTGRDFKHRSLQLDLTIPIRTRLLNFETFALVQYFDGYGESLLSYREKSESLRAGVALLR